MDRKETFLDYLAPIIEAFMVFIASASAISIPVLGLAWLAGTGFGPAAQLVVYAFATSTTIAVMVRRELSKLK
ncbi:MULTISPECIES: hypothetical protein [unclassified Mesorhizobium]|uniref:hypothetical protein n=1 Tax=unclassified Mesorhizobium TaxID=325217 RepID=UPI000FD2499E|nr:MULTISPECIES: hypothetical protein [unclassified Mesorhizobium]RUW64495.1 hypothetical protein EOA28_34960 [Mesorhizobium sp. M2A.F.Ca.ET.067.02.1.1]TGT35834.1 hypothetical protein EN808_31015 [Mesorhizobium sp. M8A.F.Ca.ET.165.01.1.1]TIS47475.1 MAG: hypothetical protein E5W96_23215 [Mesorhizobium sp.]TIU54605.1 MAG: hypothetical protein E5W35_21735 [Mesorhizobium sp.]